MALFFDLIDDEVEGSKFFEGTFVDDHQGVLAGIDYYMDEFFLLDGRKEFL